MVSLQISTLRSAALCGTLLLGGLLAGCHGQKAPKTEPNIDGLTQILKQTAGQTLAAPGLASEQIAVDARPGEADARAVEIVNAAASAGGTAIRSTEGGEISILANVPQSRAAAFKARVLRRHIPADAVAVPVVASSAPADGMETIEVRVRTAAAPAESPTPP